jgi:hypothetical protein
MLIVLQSFPEVLTELRRRADQRLTPAQLENILFTSNHREALDYVLAEKRKPDRTVVISSTVFYAQSDDTATNDLNAAILSASMKDIDPEMWFFTYSTAPQTSEHIDGAIPKSPSNMYGHALEFLTLDLADAKSLDELHEQIPWIAPS